MTLLIRSRAASDHAAIAKIFDSLAVIAQTSQLPFRSAEFWAGIYGDATSQASVLVAELDGVVVGHLGLVPDRRARRRHVGSFGLAVDQSSHGRGVGTALMTKMLELADDWYALRRVELDVYADNTHAIHLYKRFEFVEEGRSRMDTLRAGEYVDALQMARIHPKYR